MVRLAPRSSATSFPAVPAILVLAALLGAACVRPGLRSTAGSPSRIDIGQLWQEPVDLERRDLLHGPGGSRLAPDRLAVYRFEARDETGYSRGFDVAGPDGRKWSVKLGREAQPEVVASRVLWALGYHQPAVYYLPQWTLEGEVAGVQGAGRFRLEDPAWNVVSDWSWYQNDFVGTQPFNGLIVANLVLNNWDLKTSNNKIVEQRENGSSARLFVVRDLGAALGRTTFPALLNFPGLRLLKQGTRNDIQGFESQRLIKHVRDGRVEFDYRGMNEPLVRSVRPADVVWMCRLMSRLSDEQWDDAFRAAGYPADLRDRFVRKIKSKIAEGLSLEHRAEPAVGSGL